MNARHIAFINFPYAPHVNPTLPIVSTLVRRGYRVTFVTSEKFASAVAGSGAEVVPCSPFVLDIKASYEPDFEPHEPYSQQVLEEITPFYKKNPPNLVLYDFMALAGRILAKQSGIPAIQTSPFYAFLDEDFAEQIKHDVLSSVLTDHAWKIGKFLSAYGIDSTNYRVDKEKLNIYLFPRAIQPRGAEFGENCYFAGRCPCERTVNAQWEDNSGDRPIALVSMTNLRTTGGSVIAVPEHFFMSIEALSSLGWHIVLALNERCDRSSLHRLPDTCEIIHPSAFLKVLARAQLLVFNSGTITTAEAAYHGVPLIAVTEGVPEFEWQGDHIAKLGIGVHLRKEATNSANLREAALRLSSDTAILHQVQKIKHAVRREPGAEEAANRIEEYLEAGV
jgi:MGT family glycosyltransferase